MTDLFNKIQAAFGEFAVDKRLAYKVELNGLPRFVSEYLISEFIVRGEGWEEQLNHFVAENFHEPKERDRVLHILTTFGSTKIIDELKVWVDISTGTHYAVVPSLNIVDALVDMNIVNANQNTLSLGIWGLLTLRYEPNMAKDGDIPTPVMVTDFTPFQAPNVDIQLFRDAREQFEMEEWIDCLVNTLGLDHQRYTPRQKIVLLTRLVSLAEPNTHLMEFGPRATGKTYTYRNYSYYSRIISGGNMSPASLFYNLRTKVPGELATKDAVIFDEVSKVRFSNPDEMVGKLKDYMESGHYERGDKKGVSTSSVIYMGNISVEKREGGFVPQEEFTYVLPETMRDSAFIDRISGIIPGWELPKISQSRYHLSKGYGIASDYFAELLHELRKLSFSSILDKYAEFYESYTIRDEKSVKKISSGLIKLIFPNEIFSKEEIEFVLNIAVEYRQRVRDWLHILAPGEFQLEKLGYELKK